MKNFLFLSLLLAGLGGCSMPHMVVPDTLGAAETLEVRGRTVDLGFFERRAFSFGPYGVERLRRGAVTLEGSIFENLFSSDESYRQGITFSLVRDEASEAVPVWDAACKVRARGRSGDGAITGSYRCNLTPADESRRWELALTYRPGLMEEWIGAFGNRDLRMHVKSVHKLTTTSIPWAEPAGFVIEREDGRVLAAVEVINNGRVLIASGLDAELHAALTAAASALLTLDGIEEVLEDEA